MPSAAIRSPRIAGCEEALLLVVGAELPDRRRGDPDVRADPGREPARAAAAELLAEHRVVEVAAAAAAVLDRVLQPEQAELGHALEDLVREPLRRLPLGRMRPQLLGDEPPDLRAQRLVLLREGR